jgi:hypothetical protein
MSDIKIPGSRKFKLALVVLLLCPFAFGAMLYVTFVFVMPGITGIAVHSDASWLFYAGIVGGVLAELSGLGFGYLVYLLRKK